MIPADHPLKNAWDLWVALLTVFAAVEIPLRVAFALPLTPLLLAVEALLSISFAVDLVLHFFTTVRERNGLIHDRASIARRYLRTWFVPDLLAALPVAILFPGATYGLQWTLRLGRLLELNRLFKLAEVAERLRQERRHLLANPSLIRLAMFFFWMTLGAHWIACGWVFIGGEERVGSVTLTYLNAVYWAITTLTTVGYGDITPDAPLEKVYTILVMLTGVVSFGYMIGNVAGVLENMDAVRRDQARKMDRVNAFLKYREVPAHLRERVQGYYDHLWEGDFDHDEAAVLADLPTDLRLDISLFMHRGLIERVPFFRDASEEFIRDIVLLLQPRLLLPGTEFIREGAVGDSMYFISHGEVEVTSGDGRTVYDTLGPGSIVGEMALLMNAPRSASVRTRGYCDVYVLAKQDFLRVLQDHPNFKAYIDRTIRRRLGKITARRTK